jgi:hypothetical protein
VTTYDSFPEHPLCGVSAEVLESARKVLRAAVEDHDVDPEMADPLADAVVLALVVDGHLEKK